MDLFRKFSEGFLVIRQYFQGVIGVSMEITGILRKSFEFLRKSPEVIKNHRNAHSSRNLLETTAPEITASHGNCSDVTENCRNYFEN